jgi:hypothetical protein
MGSVNPSDENKLVETFDRFWTEVDRAEHFVHQHGHLDWQPHYRDYENRPLLLAYDAVEPFLRRLSRNRLVQVPHEARGMNPYEAANAHQALMIFLNPPEALFGQVGLLRSAEYLEIKREAYEELRQTQSALAGRGEQVPRSQGMRGRPPDTNQQDDKRIYDAWKTGRFRRYADLAKEKGKSPLEVRRAVDRHRKRVAKQNVVGKNQA